MFSESGRGLGMFNRALFLSFCLAAGLLEEFPQRHAFEAVLRFLVPCAADRRRATSEPHMSTSGLSDVFGFSHRRIAQSCPERSLLESPPV